MYPAKCEQTLVSEDLPAARVAPLRAAGLISPSMALRPLILLMFPVWLSFCCPAALSPHFSQWRQLVSVRQSMLRSYVRVLRLHNGVPT